MPNPKTPYLPGLSLAARSVSHGGDLREGKRKSMRPLDPKQLLHVVLRARSEKGARSMLDPEVCNSIDVLVRKVARKWGVRLERYANVGNHLHLLVRFRSRRDFQAFAREASGAIAVIMTGARKGMSGKYWGGLLFTRIVSWGKDLERVKAYLVKNAFEAAGVPMKKLLSLGFRIVNIPGS